MTAIDTELAGRAAARPGLPGALYDGRLADEEPQSF